MPKRFTDTEKWDRPWFRKLPAKYKLLWCYILDKCDIAGVWYVDFEMAMFVIGEPLDASEAVAVFEKQIQEFNSGKQWHIKDFISFQYGQLSQECNPHKGVIRLIERYGITLEEGLPKGYQTLQDKDKDSSLKKLHINVKNEKGPNFEEIWSKYPKKDGRKEAERHFGATVKTEENMVQIRRALANYLGSEVVRKGFIKNGSTWFNNWEDWIDYEEKDPYEHLREPNGESKASGGIPSA